MELFFPGLLLLGIVLFGWFANFYLIYQFVLSHKNRTPRSRWSAALGVGWLLLVVGGIARLLAPSGFDPGTFQAKRAALGIGSLLWLAGIGVWIYGFFLFRKSRRVPLLVPGESAGQEGVWPPAPEQPPV